MAKTLLQELRRESKITQQQLAEKLDVKRSTIAGWETDARQIDFGMLIKICDFFDVSIDYFLKRKDY